MSNYQPDKYRRSKPIASKQHSRRWNFGDKLVVPPLNTDNGPETNEYQNLLETGFVTEHSNIVEHPLSNAESVNENINDITKTCIEDITNFQISDPIHALKYIQSKIVPGRKLDNEQDLSTSITCATNNIVVVRFNILSTGMQEMRYTKSEADVGSAVLW